MEIAGGQFGARRIRIPHAGGYRHDQQHGHPSRGPNWSWLHPLVWESDSMVAIHDNHVPLR